MKKKREEERAIVCQECGEEFYPDLELFAKYHSGNICFNCSRERFEAEIGFDND